MRHGERSACVRPTRRTAGGWALAAAVGLFPGAAAGKPPPPPPPLARIEFVEIREAPARDGERPQKWAVLRLRNLSDAGLKFRAAMQMDFPYLHEQRWTDRGWGEIDAPWRLTGYVVRTLAPGEVFDWRLPAKSCAPEADTWQAGIEVTSTPADGASRQEIIWSPVLGAPRWPGDPRALRWEP